uniref:TIR domain-containing protein n=1 Tax=Strigamia maritima TaxID=126957 RepID=T1IV21_STRMM
MSTFFKQPTTVLYKIHAHQWILICLISSITVHCKLEKCTNIWKNALPALDNCTCEQSSNNISLIVCKRWSPRPFTFEIRKNDDLNTVKVNGMNSSLPITFIQWFLPVIEPELSHDFKFYSLVLSNFCNDPSLVMSNHHLNLSRNLFNGRERSLKVLTMSNNCLQSITGSGLYITKLDLSFNNFTQIPSMDLLKRFKYKLIKFDISNNNINNVSNTDLSIIINLLELNLSNNNLYLLPKDLLHNLDFLEEIDLSHNYISVLPKEFLKENKQLVKFDISYNNLSELERYAFYYSTELVVINASHNKIKSLDLAMTRSDKLKVFNLEMNDIIVLQFDSLPYLKSLKELLLTDNSISKTYQLLANPDSNINCNISNNKLATLKIPLTSYILKADVLDMSNNCIENYEVTKYKSSQDITDYKCSNCCLDTIQSGIFDSVKNKVDISFNNITKLDERTLNTFKNIPNVILSHNKITEVNLTYFEMCYVNEDKKVEFDLSFNPLMCDCRLNQFIKYLDNQVKPFKFKPKDHLFCSDPAELSGRSLKTINYDLLCNYPVNCPKSCHCSVDDIDNISLVLIDCSNSNLTHFPNIFSYGSSVIAIQLNLSHNHIFTLPPKSEPIWKKITILDLSYNRIDSLENMTVAPNLTTLYLNHNSIRGFDYQIVSRSHLAHLKLAYNPWKCDCEMSKFVEKSSVFEDKHEMSCEKDKILYHFAQVDQICKKFNLLWLLLPSIIIIIIIFVIIILFIKYKSEIVYYMFSKGICLRFVCEEDIDADKVYDAFVSYSSEDEDWITDFLVPGLETGTPTYSLCLHNRDWRAGEFITDQIVKSVESSRRTIIVLTDNYLKSGWSRLEFDIAYQQGLKDKVRRVIAVVPNDVPDLSQIDANFRTFITLTTYIQANKPHFWSKLRASLPRTKDTLASSNKSVFYLDTQRLL